MIHSEIIQMLLEKRGMSDEGAQQQFLAPDYSMLHDPFLFPDMRRACARVIEAMEAGETIAIYSDFDCDGIPGAAVLFDFFKKVQYPHVEVYIPHRDREGYGFHVSAIDVLKEKKVSLIITVDVGTVAIDSVAHAQDLGIDVIVTDHHEIHGETPPCYALINPKYTVGETEYPCKDLCGAGTAFKLVQGLLAMGKEVAHPRIAQVPEGWEKWLLDLVAIATIADMVPLLGENRVLTYWGLQVLRKSRRPGIGALCLSARARKADLTEDDIGFVIAPRINAASRMGEPELAFRLLTTESVKEADAIAVELEALNTSRKSVVSGIVRQAKKRMKERFSVEEKVAVLGDTEWKPALLGLAANSVLDGRKGIVCLWGRDANGNLKGSCRSDGSASVVELFTHAKASLIEFGGHHASGGFSISHEHVQTVVDTFKAAIEKCVPVEVSEITTDLDLSVRALNHQLHTCLMQLSPYGVGNPKPLFRVTGRIFSVRIFGKDKNHTELQLVCDATGARVRAFQFFKKPESFTYEPRPDFLVTVVGTLEKDSYKGPTEIALRIRDVHQVA